MLRGSAAPLAGYGDAVADRPTNGRAGGLALVLMVVGAKMLTAKWLKEMLGSGFNFFLLGFVLLILAAGVGASLIAERRGDRRQESR